MGGGIGRRLLQTDTRQVVCSGAGHDEAIEWSKSIDEGGQRRAPSSRQAAWEPFLPAHRHPVSFRPQWHPGVSSSTRDSRRTSASGAASGFALASCASGRAAASLLEAGPSLAPLAGATGLGLLIWTDGGGSDLQEVLLEPLAAGAAGWGVFAAPAPSLAGAAGWEGSFFTILAQGDLRGTGATTTLGT